jgi:hypothetical protein
LLQKTPDGYKDVADAFAKDDNVLVAKFDASSEKDEAKKLTGLPVLKWFPPHSKTPVDFTGSAGEPTEVIEFVHFQLKPELKKLKDLAKQYAKDVAKRTGIQAEARAGTFRDDAATHVVPTRLGREVGCIV